jgi:hypothetical protein
MESVCLRAASRFCAVCEPSERKAWFYRPPQSPSCSAPRLGSLKRAAVASRGWELEGGDASPRQSPNKSRRPGKLFRSTLPNRSPSQSVQEKSGVVYDASRIPRLETAAETASLPHNRRFVRCLIATGSKPEPQSCRVRFHGEGRSKGAGVEDKGGHAANFWATASLRSTPKVGCSATRPPPAIGEF